MSARSAKTAAAARLRFAKQGRDQAQICSKATPFGHREKHLEALSALY